MHRLPPRAQLRAFVRYLRTQLRYDYNVREAEETSTFLRPAALATPRQLVQYLDQYVIGQDGAKKVLSVAVFNHYNRVRANLARIYESEGASSSGWKDVAHEANQLDVSPAQIQPHPHRLPIQTPMPLDAELDVPHFEKSNVLVIGPTGSGKTLLARTLARVLDVPFSVNDATSFTQAGYVGEDVDMCIHRLLQAASWDERRASTGIVYIDEVDKLARKSGGSEGQRDVGGEGVQQAFLRMIEGTSVSIHTKGSPPPDVGTVGGSGRSRSSQKGAGSSDPISTTADVYTVDTSNVLFILSGSFVGLEKIVKQRLLKGSIGFTANLSRSVDDDEGTSKFVPFFTPNAKGPQTFSEMVEATDIVKFGFIPEFVSRMPTITTLAHLTPADLLRILTDVRGSLVSQYTALFGYSGVEIKFTTPALKKICRKAAERGGGARGLRGILESLLLDPMYEVPGSNVKYVLVTEAVAKGEQPALYWTKGEGGAFWTAWAEEETSSNQC